MSALDRSKLAAVLERLASDQAGERDAAAHAATRLVKASGLSWEQVPTAPVPVNDHHRVDAGLSELVLLRRAQARREFMTEWERFFIAAIERLLVRGCPLTGRQRAKLLELAWK